MFLSLYFAAFFTGKMQQSTKTKTSFQYHFSNDSTYMNVYVTYCLAIMMEIDIRKSSTVGSLTYRLSTIESIIYFAKVHIPHDTLPYAVWHTAKMDLL